jgi:hypothetical protein
VLNTDWFYRRLAPSIIGAMVRVFMQSAKAIDDMIISIARTVMRGAKWVSDHPISGPVIPGPAALVQVIVLIVIMASIYANIK